MAHITLAVTGSIAAYKAADLTSQLVKEGHQVTVLLSESASQFIRPLTFQSLSKNTVYSDLMDESDPRSIQHIAIAKQTDLFLVAPATANTIAKLAHGFADTIVTSVALALPKTIPKLIAPAMNTQMYKHPATKSNLQQLKEYGFTEISPKESLLACGDTGIGALAEIEIILEKVRTTL